MSYNLLYIIELSYIYILFSCVHRQRFCHINFVALRKGKKGGAGAAVFRAEREKKKKNVRGRGRRKESEKKRIEEIEKE